MKKKFELLLSNEFHIKISLDENVDFNWNELRNLLKVAEKYELEKSKKDGGG